MIDKYILEKDKDKLLDLSFNLNNKEEFDKIFDFFLQERDHYCLGELLSISPDFVDPSEDAKKIISTEDQEFVFYILNYGPILSILSPKFFKILSDYLNNNK